jgi:hypothetical protein
MLSSYRLAEQLYQVIQQLVRFIKARQREEASFALAALSFWVGYSFSDLLTPELRAFLDSWQGVLIFQAFFYVTGLGMLAFGGYQIWRLVQVPHLPPPSQRPSAIKGAMAYTPEDGPLFRRLGREVELQRLLAHVLDDQVPMIVLMGASGSGKTSLLRAGLTHILMDKGVDYHYWEAVPNHAGDGLLRAIQETWKNRQADATDASVRILSSEMPSSLNDLINPSSSMCPIPHVIVLDQFEQLRGGNPLECSVFGVLGKVARDAKPPHRITWIVSFRREFRADWSDFIIPEHEHGFFPPELSLRLFTANQARNVIGQIIKEADLSVEQSVADNLIKAATVDGVVSPIDIGIGLMVLAELQDRINARTVTTREYQFAGGDEGLLTQYVSRCLETLPESDREQVLKALLALRDPQTSQRLAEGLTVGDIARKAEADPTRLKPLFERLAQRDIRLLETVATDDQTSSRYRLPHERLVPAIQRLTGKMLAEFDQVKLKLENSFLAWKNNERKSRFLLKARDLRLILRYQSEIPWGSDEQEKQDFLRKSEKRRNRSVLATIAVAFFLAGGVWWGYGQSKQFEARRYLRESGYPEELYDDWQHRIKSLKLVEPLDLERFSWLDSQSIEELTIKAQPSSNSLTGLASLSKCSALKKLTLDLGESQVSDLTPLEALSFLTQLTLNIRGSTVSDLRPLERLNSLTQLTLDLGFCPVNDLTPLQRMTSLKQLILDLGLTSERDLSPLERLRSLTELTVHAGFDELRDLTPLAKIDQRTRLTLDFSGSGVIDLTGLEHLRQRTQLALNLRFTGVRDLTPLEKLESLTQLTLSLTGNSVSDLAPLGNLSLLRELNLHLTGSRLGDSSWLKKHGSVVTKFTYIINETGESDLNVFRTMTSLKELSLYLGAAPIRDLTPLEGLQSAMKLNIYLGRSHVSDLTPLTKVRTLRELTIYLNRSRVADLTPLTKLSSVTQLTLHFGQSTISGLTKLEDLGSATDLTLIFTESRLRDLTPLERLNSVTRLTLQLFDSEVSDLTPLEKLTSVQQLNLSPMGSEVSDLTSLGKLEQLKSLSIERATKSQRMTLRRIPNRLVHLEF